MLVDVFWEGEQYQCFVDCQSVVSYVRLQVCYFWFVVWFEFVFVVYFGVVQLNVVVVVFCFDVDWFVGVWVVVDWFICYGCFVQYFECVFDCQFVWWNVVVYGDLNVGIVDLQVGVVVFNVYDDFFFVFWMFVDGQVVD